MFESILTNILLGASLAVDAFAVTVGECLAKPKNRLKNAVLRAVYFGAFQAIMPLIGFYLAGTVSDKMMSIGPYISFFMLALVGGRMLIDSIRSNGEEEKNVVNSGEFSHARATILAIATSIDALAVGVSFAFTESNIFLPVTTIGITTFIICTAGGILCSKLPKSSGRTAGIIGGCVLIGNGIKILIEGVFL